MAALRKVTMRVALALVAAVTAVAGGLASRPAEAGQPPPERHWVTAWSAAPQGPSTLGAFGAELLAGYRHTRTLQELAPPPAAFTDETIRQVMYLHHGGTALRIQLSNLFGTAPARFPAVTLGRRAGDRGADLAAGTPRAVTFGGRRSVTIPRGASVLSDPVPLTVRAFDSVVLSIFVPAGNGAATVHGSAQQTFFTAAGDRTASASGAGFTERGLVATHVTATLTTAAYYATGIQVDTDRRARTLVTLGDSITDGFLSSGNTNTRYPDFLARRLQAGPCTRHLSVTNQAISGSRVTSAGIGPAIADRLQREVLDQPNVAGVIYLQGINDLGNAAFQDRPATPAEVIAGYRAVADRLHARGIPVFLGTLTPAGNLLRPTPYGVYSTPQATAARAEINEWIRTEGRTVFDGVVDFDRVVRDPLLPDHLQLRYDSGDNLHPNDAGYRAMAESIPSELLSRLVAPCGP